MWSSLPNALDFVTLTFWQLFATFKLLLSHFLTVSLLLASVSSWIIFIHSVKQPCSLTISQPGSAHSFTAWAAVWDLEGLALAWRDFHSSISPAKSLSACKMQCEFCLLMKCGNGSDGPWNLGMMKTPLFPKPKENQPLKLKDIFLENMALLCKFGKPALQWLLNPLWRQRNHFEKISFDVWSSWKLSMSTKASMLHFFTCISYTQ